MTSLPVSVTILVLMPGLGHGGTSFDWTCQPSPKPCPSVMVPQPFTPFLFLVKLCVLTPHDVVKSCVLILGSLLSEHSNHKLQIHVSTHGPSCSHPVRSHPTYRLQVAARCKAYLFVVTVRGRKYGARHRILYLSSGLRF